MSNQHAGRTTGIRTLARRVAVGTVAVGALSVGALGIAGTAGAATTVPKVGTHFNCSKADAVLTRIAKGEAQIKAGLPKLTAAEQKAATAGHTKLAAALQKRITRFESSTFQGRLTAATQKIEAVCPGSAPTGTGTTTGS
jgi:hypothetical protein